MKMVNRRDFVKIGSVGAGLSTMGLTNLALAEEATLKDNSVIWIWLGGGPTQFETFHPPKEDTYPDEFKPVHGILHDKKTDIRIGGQWTNLIKHADKLNVVDSFSHGDSSHRQATHWMMTSHYNSERAQTSMAKYPSHGSIVSTIYGPNNHKNGMPTYVKQGRIEGEDPAWLGGAFKPFDPSNKDNLTPRVGIDRFELRNQLLKQLNLADIESNSARSVLRYNDQAYDVILGDSKYAFDLDKEDKKVKERYGNSSIGNQLLLARRLIEYGTRFVTIHYGGWDMHGNIANALKGRIPPLDAALSALISDVWERSLNKNVLVIVTGEFGRTKLNRNSGRDHWPAMTPMLMVGGDYPSGRTIGEADKSYSPKGSKLGPIDLAATMFDHFGIPQNIQRIDNGGRPRYLLEGEAKVIL